MFHIDEKGRPERPVCALLDGVRADPPRAKKPNPLRGIVALDRWRARCDAFVASKAVLLTAPTPGSLGTLIGRLLSCVSGMLS